MGISVSKRLGRREREKLRERANEAFKLSRSGFTPQGSVKVEARIPSVSYRRSTANSSVLVPSLKYETVTVIHEREGFGGNVTPQKFLQGSKTGKAIMVPLGRSMPNIRRLEPDKPETNPDTGEPLPPIHRGSGVSGGTHLPRSLTRNTAQSWGEPSAVQGRIESRRGKRKVVKPKLTTAQKLTNWNKQVRARDKSHEQSLDVQNERKELVCWLTERPKKVG